MDSVQVCEDATLNDVQPRDRLKSVEIRPSLETPGSSIKTGLSIRLHCYTVPPPLR